MFELVIQIRKGAANTVSFVIALIGLLAYTAYMKHWRYRTVLYIFQVFACLISALDIILVSFAKDQFWGHFIAVSDRAGQRVHFQLTGIVTLVAVSDHMPDAGEATATAFLMAISNITGGDLLSPLAGSWLLDGLGVSRGNYDNLVWAVVVRTVVRLLPIPFIPLLVPSGCSLDKVRYDIHDLETKEAELIRQNSQKDKENRNASDVALYEQSTGNERGRGTGFFHVFRSLSSRMYVGVPEQANADKNESDIEKFSDNY